MLTCVTHGVGTHLDPSNPEAQVVELLVQGQPTVQTRVPGHTIKKNFPTMNRKLFPIFIFISKHRYLNMKKNILGNEEDESVSEGFCLVHKMVEV